MIFVQLNWIVPFPMDVFPFGILCMVCFMWRVNFLGFIIEPTVIHTISGNSSNVDNMNAYYGHQTPGPSEFCVFLLNH